MATLSEMLKSEKVSLDEIADHLENLPHKWRLIQTLELGNKEQSKLWELAKVAPPIDQSYLMPADAPFLKPYPFEGKNSLPAFSRFQKVFYRQPNGVIGGYNNQKMAWVTGPGYYVVRDNRDRWGEIEIDYTSLPFIQPVGWPAITDNMAGLSRFVYGGTRDYLRRVSKDVVIGRATRAAKDMPNWFILCRQEPIEK